MKGNKMKTIETLGIVLLVVGCFLIQPIVAVSMEEVQRFLINDTTNERTYNDQRMPYYTCGHFTQDLIANASKERIRMYPVDLSARTGHGHIIAAVNINNTWVFIEPINDGIYTKRILKKVFRSYWIGTHVKCSPYLPGSEVNGLVELGMF